MKIDIESIGYRWQGVYSPYLAYRERDVVYRNGGAWVYKNGKFVEFAIGQPDASKSGELIAGKGVALGRPNMVLHSKGEAGVEFRFMDGRNGVIATQLAITGSADHGAALNDGYMQAIMSDGSVRGWGSASNGVLGDGGGATTRVLPVKAAFPPGTPPIVKVVHAQNSNSYYIDAKGGLWYSGLNGDYASGNGNSVAQPKPVKMNGSGDLPADAVIIKVFSTSNFWAYRSYGCLDNQGRAYLWGGNRNNHLGVVGVVPAPKLVPFTTDVPIKDIFLLSGYGSGTHLLSESGILYVCGEGIATGLGVDISNFVPFMPWGFDKRVKKVAACDSDDHNASGNQYYRGYGVLLEDGSFYRWGHDSQNHGWGTGFTGGIFPQSTNGNLFPYKVLDGVEDFYIGSGNYTRCVVLMKDGTIMHAGYGGNGLADGAVNNPTWARIGAENLKNVTKLRGFSMLYGSALMALRSDGTCVGWGFGAGFAGNGQPSQNQNQPNLAGVTLLDKKIVDFSLSGQITGGMADAMQCHFLTAEGGVYSSGTASAALGELGSQLRLVPAPILF